MPDVEHHVARALRTVDVGDDVSQRGLPLRDELKCVAGHGRNLGRILRQASQRLALATVF